MIVKSDIGNWISSLIMFICSVGASLCMYTANKSIAASLGMFVPTFLISVRYWISACRTITLHSKGCNVSILWFRNNYCWGDLDVREYFALPDSYGYKDASIGGVEISRKKIKRPKHMKPATFSALFRPWSYVYLYFYPDELPSTDAINPRNYPVSERELFAKLCEWGVLIKQGTVNAQYDR